MKRVSFVLGFAVVALGSAGCTCGSPLDIGAFDGSASRFDASHHDRTDPCGNGFDDDGNGRIDDGCPCAPGETQRCFAGERASRGVGSCEDGTQICHADGTEWGDWGSSQCEGGQTAIAETCDGMDHDCDGAIDEGCPCTAGDTRECGLEFLSEPCRGGTQACNASGAWSGCDGAIGPTEDICDGVDNDCDGRTDLGCGCPSPEPERCRDGIDNDCDGETDEPACTPDWPLDGGISIPDAGPCEGPNAPTLIAPISTSSVTRRRPLLEWALAAGTDGAQIHICADRGCSRMLTTFDVVGSSGTPASALPLGPVFWRAYGRSGDRIGTCPSPTWEFFTGNRDAPVNSYWGTTLDVNGDGFADLAIGAYQAGWTCDDSASCSSCNAGPGRVHVYHGSPTGLPASPTTTIAYSGSGPGLATNRTLGESVSSAGDINGDGFGDLVAGTGLGGIGALGMVNVYLGGPTGVATMPSVTLTGPDMATDCDHFDGGFGYKVSSAGDVNHDGYSDLLVGAPFWDPGRCTGSSAGINSGRAYLFLGGPAGPAATPAHTWESFEGGGSYFGMNIGEAGDLNGDRIADMILGGQPSRSYDERIRVAYGSLSGTATIATIASPEASHVGFGSAVASADDVNGDGYADLIVGAPSYDPVTFASRGRVFVYSGGTAGLAPMPTTTLTGVDPAGRFGYAVKSSMDINADGFSDLLVTSIGGSGQGQVFVFRGASGGVIPTPALSIPDPLATQDNFGRPLARGRDVNGDGYADVVAVVVSKCGFEGMTVGTAYVFPGSPVGLPTMPSLSLDGPDGVSSRFGWSFY